MFHNILTKYKLFFGGTLGTWKNKIVDKELNQMPIHTM